VHVGVEANPDAKRGHRMLVHGGRSISYQYEPRTRVLSGPGSIVKLYAELDAMGKRRALVVTDAGVVRAGLLARLREVLGPRIAAVFDAVEQDSGFGIVDAAIALGRSADADVVVSLGGGSCIDTAKTAAVGLANGRNPVAIVVPCHRVIGSDGSMTGYGGGLDRKRFLLALEQGSGA